jgi:enoyl-CoA hydratase/carnithine racemase
MFEIKFHPNAAVLTMSNGPVNALSKDFVEKYHLALDTIQARKDIAVLHIKSGLRVFSAGADLKQVETRFDLDPDIMVADIRQIHALFDRIEALPCVTLAEIAGAALGGGYELALACDLRIAADDVPIGLPETGLGLFPGAGGTQRLNRLCGPGVTARIILTAEPVTGAVARELGMVQWAHPAAELSAAADALRDKVAALSPTALRLAKQCMAAWFDPAQNGYALELENQRVVVKNEDTRRRVSAFVQERANKAAKSSKSERAV